MSEAWMLLPTFVLLTSRDLCLHPCQILKHHRHDLTAVPRKKQNLIARLSDMCTSAQPSLTKMLAPGFLRSLTPPTHTHSSPSAQLFVEYTSRWTRPQGRRK